MSRSVNSLRIGAVALAEPLIVEAFVMADLARGKDLGIWAAKVLKATAAWKRRLNVPTGWWRSKAYDTAPL